MDWKDFLPGRKPRDEISEPFAADAFDVEHPALLTDNSVLSAAAVAARVLEILAFRGGTRIKPSAAEKLRRLVWRALPKSAANLCDDEASRVLRWLTEGEAYELDADAHTDTPEVDIMFEADIESRISVAQFALDEGYDLELEYLDTREKIWPRIRCTPLELISLEADDDANEEQAEPALLVDSDFGELDIPIHHIRWLMPVSSHRHRRAEGTKKPAGKLLSFPTGDKTD